MSTPTSWTARLRLQGRTFVALAVLQIVSVGAGLALPALNADLIDEGVARGDQQQIWVYGGWMLLVCLVQLSAAVGAMYLGSTSSVEFGRRLRDDVFTATMRMSPGQVRRFGPATLLTRATNDVMQVQMLVLMVTTVLVTAPLTMIGAVVLGVRQDASLAWLMAVAVPVLLLVIAVFTALSLPGYRRMQPQMDRVNLVLREQLGGLRPTRVFLREHHERRRFDQANDDLIDTSIKVGRLYLSLGPVVTLVMSLGSVLVVWVGAHRVDDGSAQIGSVLAFITYLAQLMSAVLMCSAVVIQFPRARISAGRLREVLDSEPELTRPTGEDRPREHGELRVDNLTLTHPDATSPILRDVDLKVEPGGLLALVGATGSGKSTLIEALHGAVTAERGVITLGGTKLRELNGEDLRRRVAVVPQRAQLFSGTIRTNLQFADPTASDERMQDALHAAGVDFLDELGGLDAPVAPSGGNFSGGQRQRLCIARALVGSPDLLLLDDSLSALDGVTAQKVMDHLDGELDDTTVVIATNRVSVASRADAVALLDRGTVHACGPHGELARTSPEYREFVSSQTGVEEPV